jgi:hypothetical protein
MKPILTGALIAGALYFLLRDNIAAFMSPAAPAPAGTPPADTTTPPAAAPPILQAVSNRITAAGSASILATAQGPDTWGFYFNQVYPNYPAPAPETIWPTKANPREPVTLQQWFAALAPLLPAAGLAGAGAGAVLPMKRRPGRQAWS